MEEIGMSCKCGQESCNGVCSYSVGRRLAVFLKEIDTVSTLIGDIDKSGYSKESLIVTGLAVYTDGSVSKILKPTSNVVIPMEERFTNYNGKNPRALLKEYITKSGYDKGQELINTMKLIEENKIVFMPFKTKQTCDVIHTRTSKRKEVNGKNVECRTTIESIKWSIVDNIDKLQCTLIVSMVDPDTAKKVKLNVQDYGEKFTLVDLERLHAKSGLQGQIIKMTKFGYARPIEINNNGNAVIVDNCSVYVRYKESAETRVVGSWVNGKIVYSEKIKDAKIEKALNANEDYIGKHRRWYAPYGLCETNKINVK